ncbi:NCS1 family nucleobase:cation symporter-1 [Actinoplanes sp. URMC 104]|uniref:NCS1 family nucleobase:cation symporter-1 n=1 Tax=Actinoplanes sp. URMC 104 TaxID=3423409 RepID=UPI003F1A93D3
MRHDKPEPSHHPHLPHIGGDHPILHQPPAEALATPGMPAISERLYNQDLAPTRRAGRRWGAYNIFTLWANDVHSLGNYVFAVGLFALGLGAWQIMLSFLLGAVLLFLLLSLSGFMGEKLGVPFPVLSRVAFGIHGAQIAAIARGGVAIVWFGIQTYLASVVLRVLLIAVAPGLASWDRNSFLGLSTLGWIAFVVLWVLQVIVVSYGMEMIRKYEAFAGPVILLTMLALAVWLVVESGGSIAFSTADSLSGGEMWWNIVVGGALWIAIYGTFVLNFCDFTRNATSRTAIIRGNFFGIPLNMLFFGAIVVTLAGAQYRINGEVIESPADIVRTIPNTLLLVLACLALLVLTVAVNLMANFVAPIYMLTNLLPRVLDFRRAGLVSAVIGLVILPWNLYNSPAVIVYFLGGLGAILGPLFGVIMADYWILRRTKVNVPDLFTEDPGGDYHYRGGFNMLAVAALVPAAVIAILFAVLPVFSEVSGVSWFIGAALGALFYLPLGSRRTTGLRDVSGEPIAVASVH